MRVVGFRHCVSIRMDRRGASRNTTYPPRPPPLCGCLFPRNHPFSPFAVAVCFSAGSCRCVCARKKTRTLQIHKRWAKAGATNGGVVHMPSSIGCRCCGSWLESATDCSPSVQRHFAASSCIWSKSFATVLPSQTFPVLPSCHDPALPTSSALRAVTVTSRRATVIMIGAFGRAGLLQSSARPPARCARRWAIALSA